MTRFTEAAERELEEVAEWFEVEFGGEVAERYVGELHEVLVLCEKVPGVSKSVPGHERFRRVHRGSHWLYFLHDQQGLLVVRVVHEKQLPPSQRP